MKSPSPVVRRAKVSAPVRKFLASREPRTANRELRGILHVSRSNATVCVRKEVVMLAMGNVPVFCATTEGQTRRIAAEIAATLREQGFVSDVHCLSEAMPAVNWLDVRGVVVGASIHAGRHQKAAVDFVTREARHLSARPSAFFSVSLSAASRNPAEVDAARGLATHFARQAGWEPTRVLSIAGKLAYSQIRFRDPTDHAVHRVAGRGSDRHQPRLRVHGLEPGASVRTRRGDGRIPTQPHSRVSPGGLMIGPAGPGTFSAGREISRTTSRS